MKYCTILDTITASCIGGYPLLPYLGVAQLHLVHPHVLFVESAWHGWHKSWKFKIASYPDHPKRNNHALLHLLEHAKKKHIPTVFWDKEGLIHFDRFIESAQHFDHVFTVDADTIPKYRSVMGQHASVHLLPFAVQSRIHYFDGFHFLHNTACFVGSYSLHIHPRRRAWQEMLFRAALDSGLGLHVFDRNSDRKSCRYRYPDWNGMHRHDAVSHKKTANIYKNYLVSLNVNTNETSSTMVSRRLIEIIACGGIAVTHLTPAVERQFIDYCHVVNNYEDAMELFLRLKNGPSKIDLERSRAGAAYVSKFHTWEKRLKYISQIIGVP